MKQNDRLGPLLGYYMLNPMAGVVVAYRNMFISSDPVAGALLIAPFALCWAVLGVGLVVFTRLERRFGDEL